MCPPTKPLEDVWARWRAAEEEPATFTLVGGPTSWADIAPWGIAVRRYPTEDGRVNNWLRATDKDLPPNWCIIPIWAENPLLGPGIA